MVGNNMMGLAIKQTSLFSGLRFLLAGFEEAFESQCIEELVTKKGQIGKRYHSSCTHVIVSNLTYKHPICVAARKDGKALVTDTWVADCLDADALVDVNNVLYKPLEDLDGIPGGQNLWVCLTGYKGLIRKNIMRMVEMMGAKFTKPLVGSVVTHLICYKFEGEKYELAKKTGLILVNHFWLEDCLRSWTLLPESDYAQSGWEAETLKLKQTIVQDSPEHDTAAARDKMSKRKSSCEQVLSSDTVVAHDRTLKRRSFCEQVPSSAPAPAPILKHKRGIDFVHDGLSKGANASAKSKNPDLTDSHVSPPACDGSAEEQVYPEIGRTEETPINIGWLKPIISIESKPFTADFPVCVALKGAENGNRASVAVVQKDETTDLYVDEGNESDHSSGRSSYQDMNNKSDIAVGKVELSECENTSAMVCGNVELTGIATEHIPMRRISGGKGLKSIKSNPWVDELESPGTKRRRCLLLASKLGPPLENTYAQSDEEKDVRNQVIGDEFTGLGTPLNQQVVVVQGSSVQQETLAPGAVCSNVTEQDNEMPDIADGVQKAQEIPIIGNERHMDGDGADTKTESRSEGQEKSRKSPNVGNEGHVDENGADIINTSNQGRLKGVQSTSSLGSICTDDKEDIPKSGITPSHPLTLRQLVKTYDPAGKWNRNRNKPVDEDKENVTANETNQNVQPKAIRKKKTPSNSNIVCQSPNLESSKMCFAVGGSSDERTRLHSVIKVLGGKICNSRHQWRDGTTHVVLPGPVRRTEKFLAGAAAGRWILKPGYLEASKKAGKFLEEEAYEWYGEGTNDKGSISLQAPRKWRILQTTSGIGAFHDLKVILYGECISPPLGTFKRAIKAGGGVVVATTPPYTRHLVDGVNFAIISPGIPQEDQHVQEFLKHEVACVTSEYFVDLVCHPSSPLDKYILYESSPAVKAARQRHRDIAQPGRKFPSALAHSLQHNRRTRMEPKTANENVSPAEDTSCSVCGGLDDEEVMLLCGDDRGRGCGTGIHIHCCVPPLLKVPDEDWFCSKCQV